jgi:Flp pilus assembly protein protease CpaA
MNELLLIFPIVYLSLVGIPIIYFDLRVARVPNKYTLPALYIWLICATTYAVVSGDWFWTLVMPIVFGLVSLVIFMFVSVARGYLGMGDVKLLIFMGLALSWKFAWVWLVLPSVSIALAFIVALVLVFIAKRKINSLALAPYIYFVYFVLIAILFLN